ncbi:hypothetical protein B9Z38_01190 [Limnohabitans sp. MMS-10A-160]|nr:hypothetical protein B9Z43_01515 [Limnohabitans sp. MMS-10A-192]PUE26954.1 hypothetical protein B9Z38_01190 [Limnohabitans sp. MMS-10A-160]
MNLSIRNMAEAVVLSLVSAALFAGFFRLNELIFSALEHSQGVNWIFLPAGFRVLLVLGMGLPGCLGIFLGTLYLDHAHLLHGHAMLIFLTGIVSGFTPWVVMKTMSHRGLLSADLKNLTYQQLLNFTLFYAAANAVLHQLLWALINVHSHQMMVELWPMFVVDLLGALLMLYAFKGLVNLIQGRRSSSGSL